MTEKQGKSILSAYRGVFLAYAVIAGCKIAISFAMTRHSEVDHPPVPVRATDASVAVRDGERQPLLRENPVVDPPADLPVPARLPLGRLVALCLVFSLDSFAGALAPLSFISYYLKMVHAAPVQLIAHFFSITAVIACLSQLAAGSISKRLGIIGTMVGTHGEGSSPPLAAAGRSLLTRRTLRAAPAQLLTISFGLAPNLPAALAFFVARSFLATMDASVRGTGLLLGRPVTCPALTGRGCPQALFSRLSFRRSPALVCWAVCPCALTCESLRDAFDT